MIESETEIGTCQGRVVPWVLDRDREKDRDRDSYRDRDRETETDVEFLSRERGVLT